MWIRLAERKRLKELEGRPNYYEGYDAAVEAHLDGFYITFRTRTLQEQEIKESLWRDPQGLTDFRDQLRYMMHEDSISEKDYFENLLWVRDA